MGGDEISSETEFERVFLSLLDADVAPVLSALGFEIQGPGGYLLRWNSHFDFATNIRPRKWHTFQGKFEVLFSIWMMEAEDRSVRGIWLPVSDEWRYESLESMDDLGGRLKEGILGSAVPLAVEQWGGLSDRGIAALVKEGDLEVARAVGGWHIPGGQS